MTKIISLEQAVAHVRAAAVAPEQTESVALADALGRRLAVDHHAPGPWPSTDRSAMDGFACATGGAGVAADQTFPVVGAALAGHPFDGSLDAGQAVRIMTGGVVPEGADTVVMVEHTDGFDGDTVKMQQAVPNGSNIRPMGSEIASGDLLLARGARIRSAEIGALAVLGQAEVEVWRRPRVAILATGDEVVPVDQEPSEHQVRNSNAHALAAQISGCGGEPVHLGIATDDADSLRELLTRGLEGADVVLTIGGVSKGTHDLVHGTLRELGVEQVFHGMSVKPGKPLYFGRRGDGPPFVFGLPGNPASTFTTFDLCVRPLLLRMAGAPDAETERLRLPITGQPFRKNWRTQAIPARLLVEGGRLVASLGSSRPSGDPFSMCDGDGYVLIPGDTEPGSIAEAEFVPYDSAWM